MTEAEISSNAELTALFWCSFHSSAHLMQWFYNWNVYVLLYDYSFAFTLIRLADAFKLSDYRINLLLW